MKRAGAVLYRPYHQRVSFSERGGGVLFAWGNSVDPPEGHAGQFAYTCVISLMCTPSTAPTQFSTISGPGLSRYVHQWLLVATSHLNFWVGPASLSASAGGKVGPHSIVSNSTIKLFLPSPLHYCTVYKNYVAAVETQVEETGFVCDSEPGPTGSHKFLYLIYTAGKKGQA